MIEQDLPTYCPCCRRQNNDAPEYAFKFNKGHMYFLLELRAHGGQAYTRDMALTYSQKTNCQILKHWGLISSWLTPESVRRRGAYQLTFVGAMFLEGARRINEYAHTRDGVFTRFSGKEIGVWDFAQIVNEWQVYHDYAQQAKESA